MEQERNNNRQENINEGDGDSVRTEQLSKKRKLGLDFPESDDLDGESEDQSLVDNIKYEFRSYRKDPVLDEDLEDPLGYWKINRFKYPNLIKLVKKYLCIPATSTESERTFSNFDNLLTKNVCV